MQYFFSGFFSSKQNPSKVIAYTSGVLTSFSEDALEVYKELLNNQNNIQLPEPCNKEEVVFNLTAFNRLN